MPNKRPAMTVVLCADEGAWHFGRRPVRIEHVKAAGHSRGNGGRGQGRCGGQSLSENLSAADAPDRGGQPAGRRRSLRPRLSCSRPDVVRWHDLSKVHGLFLMPQICPGGQGLGLPLWQVNFQLFYQNDDLSSDAHLRQKQNTRRIHRVRRTLLKIHRSIRAATHARRRPGRSIASSLS